MSRKYSAKEDVVFTDLDDGSAVLLHLETKYYFSLNETGCFLWKIIEDSGATEKEMVKELCELFDVDTERASIDVSEFLEQLNEQDLIEFK